MQIPKSLIINILDRAVTLECIYQATKSLNTNPEAVSIINKSILILKEKNFIDIYNLEIIINQILNSNTKFDLIELLKLNTERLLSNCFYIGHHLSNSEYDTFGAKLAIHRIGNLSEYCFHTLDDLSLFSSSNKSQINQENVVIRYLYGTSSKRERKQLDSNFDLEYADGLIHKYRITNLVLEDIDMKISFIKKSIADLQEAKPDYYADFSKFLNETFKVHFQKCGLTYANMF